MQAAQCQRVVLIPKCRIWCHTSSVLKVEDYHKKLICILPIIWRLHPRGYQKLEGAVKYKVEVESVEAEGVKTQCVIFCIANEPCRSYIIKAFVELKFLLQNFNMIKAFNL